MKSKGDPTMILGPVERLLDLGPFGPGCPGVPDGAHGPRGLRFYTNWAHGALWQYGAVWRGDLYVFAVINLAF